MPLGGVQIIVLLVDGEDDNIFLFNPLSLINFIDLIKWYNTYNIILIYVYVYTVLIFLVYIFLQIYSKTTKKNTRDNNIYRVSSFW